MLKGWRVAATIASAVSVMVLSGCSAEETEEEPYVMTTQFPGYSECQVAKHFALLVHNTAVELADAIAEETGTSWEMSGPFGPNEAAPQYSGRGGAYGFEQTVSFGMGSFGTHDRASLGLKGAELAEIVTDFGIPSAGGQVADPVNTSGPLQVRVNGSDGEIAITLRLAENGYATLWVYSVGGSEDWGLDSLTDHGYTSLRNSPECMVPGESALPGVQGASLTEVSSTPSETPSATPTPTP